jgi:hypothetical protein
VDSSNASGAQATGLSWQSQETDQYFRLIAEIIKSGLRDEGPDYLRTRGGQYWCDVGNLNPDAVWRTAAKPDPRRETRHKADLAESLNPAQHFGKNHRPTLRSTVRSTV